MLILKKDFNFDEFEASLKTARAENCLRLPSQFKHIGFWGLEVALIQLLVTWARSHKAPEIKTYINDADAIPARSGQLDDIGKRLFGIAAFYLTGKVSTAQGTEIPRMEYAGHCLNVLKQMYECDIYAPESVNQTYPKNRGKVAAQFICLHGTRYEFQRSLYNGPSRSQAIGRKEFGALIRSAIKEDKPLSASLDKMPELTSGLASLIYEIFQNTNDHAYDQLDRTSFVKNVRAITLKSHSDITKTKDLGAMKSDNTRFNSYLEHCTKLFTDKNLERHRFLEISIVDGGLGLAQRFTGKPLQEIADEDERRITADCFRDGVSSKGPLSRGEGLDEVWKALCKLDGFIRIRTGRLCLFQTFHDKNPSDVRAFSNWSKTRLEHAEGTAITLVIPCVF
ncbi:MAG: hypothetical protein V4819_20135 [Verrucomicrobiota bacterium]